MTLPIAPKRPIAKPIYDFLEVYFMEMIEESPDAVALYDEWKELMTKIEGKVPLKTSNRISDMFFAAACHYGDAMFRFGIMVGREPETILGLPDKPYAEKE